MRRQMTRGSAVRAAAAVGVLLVVVGVGAQVLDGPAATSAYQMAVRVPADARRPAAGVQMQGDPPFAPSGVAVSVLNGTRRPGLARGVAHRLRACGWRVTRVANHRAADDRTSVYYGDDAARTGAEQLAGWLGLTARRATGSGRGVTVLLGGDYHP